MLSAGTELQKATSAQHVRTQLQRSTSDVPSVTKHQRSHHYPQLHHYRDKAEKAEKIDKNAPTGLLPSASIEVLRSEGVTPNGSQHGSRRTSIVPSADDMAGPIGRQEKRRVVQDGELEAEQKKTALRASELRKSLEELNTLSHNTTSRLDNTYYNVLEKLTILHSTIASLKELATLTRQLNDDFRRESSEFVKDIEIQLEGFKNFDPQECDIEDLELRIETGREKTRTLGDRVDLVKQKIERWEKIESEWQQRTRKRLKFLWAVTAIALFLLAGLIAFQYTPTRTHGPATLRGLNLSNLTVEIPELEDVFRNETQSLKRTVNNALDKLRQIPVEELDDDPRLRAFDEL